MLGPSHWLHEISLHKRVHQHFWPGLIYPLQRTPYLSPKFVLFSLGRRHFQEPITISFETPKKCGASHWSPPPICLPFVIYIHESSTLAEAQGIKVWFYWEQFGEHVENLMGTGWEPKFGHIGNRRKQKQNKIPWHGCILVIFYEKESNTKWPTKRKTNQPTLLPLPPHPHISQHLIAPLPTMR
jgi:hypothetical protein